MMKEMKIGIQNAAKIEVAEVEKNRNNGEAKSDLVGDHLGRGADATEEGVFGVRGPTCDGNAVDRERGDGEEKERAKSEIGDGEVNGLIGAAHFKRTAEGDDGDGDEGGAHCEAGGEPEESFVDVVGGEVFFEDKLKSISDGLGESAEGEREVFFKAKDGERDAGAVGADAVLDNRGETTLGVDGVGDKGEDDTEEDADFNESCDELDEVHGLRVFLTELFWLVVRSFEFS